MPRFTLKGENIGAGNYGKGDLEDWTTSALYLNGSNQYAHITHAEMKKDIVYPKGRNENETGKVYGAYVICADMDKNNFLIELYCKVNSGRTGDLLLSKADATGYILEVDNAGKAQLRLRVGGNDVAKRSTTMAINDGKWHHIIAEVDRSVAQGIRLYIDGKQANGAFEGSMPSASASLKNTADLLVGGGPGKKYLAGAIDFLRISRGTLADAKTTIEELYDWQFVNGPHLTDFAGNEIEDNKRDAGAFEGRPSSIVSVTDRPLPAAVSLAAKHTAATLKAAVETGIQSGAEPSETVAVSTGNTGLYADSITVLLNGESMIVKDTLRVETKQKYDFTISADKTEFTLSKVTDDGSVLVAASNSKNCRVTLEANQKYVYELRIQKSNTNECTLKWQEVKE